MVSNPPHSESRPRPRTKTRPGSESVRSRTIQDAPASSGCEAATVSVACSSSLNTTSTVTTDGGRRLTSLISVPSFSIRPATCSRSPIAPSAEIAPPSFDTISSRRSAAKFRSSMRAFTRGGSVSASAPLPASVPSPPSPASRRVSRHSPCAAVTVRSSGRSTVPVSNTSRLPRAKADLAIDGRRLNRAADREVDVGMSRQEERVDRQHLEERVDVAPPSDRAIDRAGLSHREDERLDGEAHRGGQARAQGRFAEACSGQIDAGAARADASRQRHVQRGRARPNALPNAGETEAARPRLRVQRGGRSASL